MGKGITVLSLFDGMSCGQIALKKIGIKVTKYYASELDVHAIKESKKNWPNMVHLGDVTKWREWDVDWASIDLVIGGSPCQGFSMAGKQLAFNDPRSALFFTYMDIVNHCLDFNGKAHFFLENVVMKQEFLDVINEYTSTNPVNINASLIAPVSRNRNYWATWDFKEPEATSTCISDIWAGGVNVTERFNKKVKGTLAYTKSRSAIRALDQKAKCLTTHGQGISNSGATNVVIGNEVFIPGVIECCRLHGVPDDYFKVSSMTQSMRMLGNGWHVDVIAHIFKSFFNNT